MQTRFDRQEHALRLTFESGAERSAYVAAAQRESGFLVTLPVSLGLHETVVVELEAPTGASIVEARVAQVFDKGFGKFSTAFMVDSWPTGPDEASVADQRPTDPDPRRTVPASPSSSPAPDEAPDKAERLASDDDQIVDPPPDPADEIDPNEGEMRGTSPIHAIKQMNPRQRSMLALKATRTQRHILLRDNSPQVLQNLLANPQIDGEEVLQIARSSHVVAPILQRIASDARWGANQEILAIVARHPKTPSIFAARLMPNLRTSDLRMMAKMSSGLREMTRKAALREYMKRTGQRV